MRHTLSALLPAWHAAAAAHPPNLHHRILALQYETEFDFGGCRVYVTTCTVEG